MSNALSFTGGASAVPQPELEGLTPRITDAHVLYLPSASSVSAAESPNWQILLVTDGLVQLSGHDRLAVGANLLWGDALLVAPGHEYSLVRPTGDGSSSVLQISYAPSPHPPLRRVRHFQAALRPDLGHGSEPEILPMLRSFQSDGLRLSCLRMPGTSKLSIIVPGATVVCSYSSEPVETLGPEGAEVVETYRIFSPGDRLNCMQGPIIGLAFMLEF